MAAIAWISIFLIAGQSLSDGLIDYFMINFPPFSTEKDSSKFLIKEEQNLPNSSYFRG